MSYIFGEKSAAKLEKAHPDLQRVAKRALSIGVMDFSITESTRSQAKQQILFQDGKSTLDGVTKKSRHQSTPSQAIDVMPWPGTLNGVNVWTDNQRWCVLAGLFYAAAELEGVEIVWGGDWDSDGNNADSKFNDYPHYELKRK